MSGYTKGPSRNCRVCRNSYEPTAHQMAKHDYICLACRSEYHRKYRTTYLERPDVKSRNCRRAKEVYRTAEGKLKAKARQDARRAIARGIIIKASCEVCGEVKSQAHHDDYAKPLDVRWLCPVHHTEHHRKAKAEGREEGK